jgi:hypothetical protein
MHQSDNSGPPGGMLGGILGSVSERFRCVGWFVVVPFGVVFGAVWLLVAALNGSWSSLMGVLLLVAFGYIFLFVPFEATIGPDRLVTFRAVARQVTCFVEDVQFIERQHGGAGTFWKVHFIGGSSGLDGDAGEQLAGRLCQLNPAIGIDFDRVTPKPKPEALNEPDWVKRGEKVSAQELIRRQREAQRAFREERESHDDTCLAPPDQGS